MPIRWNTFPVAFKEGLITNLSLLEQGVQFPGSARTLINFEPSIEGGYKKILGFEKFVSTAPNGTGNVYGTVLTDYRSCIAVRGGVYSFSKDKSAWVQKLDLSATPSTRISYDFFNFNGTDKVVMVDGVNKPVFFEASGETITQDTGASSDVQGAERVVVFKNHIFFSKGSSIYFTSPFLETDYNTANGAGVIDVGSDIVGMIVFRDQLIIFSTDHIKRLTGNTSSDFSLLPITEKTGAIDGDTIQEVGGDILYLGPDGVRFLSATERIGDFALERASNNIQKEITDLIDSAGSFSSTVIRGKNQYRIFKYNPAKSANLSKAYLATRFVDRQSFGISWGQLSGFKVFSTCSRQFPEQETIVFCTDDEFVYEMENSNSFDGSGISCRFATPFMPISDPKIRKTFHRITNHISPEGSFEVKGRILLDYDDPSVIQPSEYDVLVNDVGTVSTYGTAVYGTAVYGSGSNTVYTSNLVGSGFTVSLEYKERSTNPPFNLSYALIEYSQNERR